MTGVLAVYESVARTDPGIDTEWPGVDDPDALRAQLAGWLSQYVQADVGHASIATTHHYDRGRRTRHTTAAELGDRRHRRGAHGVAAAHRGACRSAGGPA